MRIGWSNQRGIGLAGLVAVAAFYAMPAQAIIIDPFDAPPSAFSHSLAVASSASTLTGQNIGGTTDAIGGVREVISVLTTGTPGEASSEVNFGGFPGIVSIASKGNATADLTLLYDADSTATGTLLEAGPPAIHVNPAGGLGGIDITDGGTQNAFGWIFGLDLGGVTGTVTVWDATTGDSASLTTTLLATGGSTNFVNHVCPFSNLVDDDGDSFGDATFDVDLTDIGAISLSFSLVTAAGPVSPVDDQDFSVDLFQTVPEPSTMGFLLGGVGLAFWRRRKSVA